MEVPGIATKTPYRPAAHRPGSHRGEYPGRWVLLVRCVLASASLRDRRVSPLPLELLTLASPRIHPGALPSREGVQECGRPVMGTSRWGYGGQGGDVGPLVGDFCRSAVMRVPVEMPAAGLHPVGGV